MRSKTLLLLVLLGVVAAAAWHFHGTQGPSAVSESVAAAPQSRPEPPASVPTQFPRVEDNAAILAPFGPKLSRMAEAFSTDLGIDVQVVTSDDDAQSIEAQANEIFERRQIGREAAVC